MADDGEVGRRLGERLRAARQANGWKQDEMAKRCEVKRLATVSDWENGKAIPETDLLLRLPRILGVSGHWLLTGDGPMRPADPTEAQLRLDAVRAALDADLSRLTLDAANRALEALSDEEEPESP